MIVDKKLQENRIPKTASKLNPFYKQLRKTFDNDFLIENTRFQDQSNFIRYESSI